MITFIRRSLPLLAALLALSGCVAYPAGYGYGPGYGYAAPVYAPTVALAVPCCVYGGWHGGYGGYRRW